MRHDTTPALFLPPADPNILPDDTKRVTGQNWDVLEELLHGVRLTFHDAERMGVHRLAARINDLRKAGYAINSGRDADRKCAVYWMNT